MKTSDVNLKMTLSGQNSKISGEIDEDGVLVDIFTASLQI